jgi:hypothetical protein
MHDGVPPGGTPGKPGTSGAVVTTDAGDGDADASVALDVRVIVGSTPGGHA